jgi:chromate transporter
MTNRKIELFLRFLKLGFFTIGGGYAMVPLIEREVVDDSHWMERNEYYDAILLAQSVPGAVAVNAALVVGIRLEGVVGGAVSALAVILPSFATILAIAVSFPSFHSVPVVEAVFRGIGAVVVALIVAAGVRLARERPTVFTSVLAASGFAALSFLRVSPFLLVLVFVVIGVFGTCIQKRHGPRHHTGGPCASE